MICLRVLSCPILNSLSGLLTRDISAALLGDQSAVLLDDHEGGDPLHPVLLVQGAREVRCMLDSQPVPVRLLHVGEHFLRGLVTGHKDDLNIVHCLVESLQLGSEYLTWGAPVGRKIKQNKILFLLKMVVISRLSKNQLPFPAMQYLHQLHFHQL